MSRFARVLLVAVTVLAVLAMPSPARADTLAFDVSVTHDPTATDHVINVKVTTSGPDQAGPHTLNVFLRSDLDDQLRPQEGRSGIEVDLVQAVDQSWIATVVLPTAGEWIVLPFTDFSGGFSPLKSADQYPIVSVTIPWTGSTRRIHAPGRSSSPWLVVGAIAGGGLVAAGIALGLFRLLDRRKLKTE
jgi:hypothetical protein